MSSAGPLPGIRRRLASAVYDSMLLLGVVIVAVVVPSEAVKVLVAVTANELDPVRPDTVPVVRAVVARP